MKNILVTPDELKEIVRDSVKEVLTESRTGSAKKQTEILTRKQAAEFLDVSLVTLTEWCNQGLLKPRRLNSRVYFYRDEILEAMQGPPEMEDVVNR